MRILFDQGTPVPLRAFLTEHEILTAYECGWSTLTNGNLLEVAEKAGFDTLITTDRNLEYQQNLSTRKIAIVVLSSTNWPRIRVHVERVQNVLATLEDGGFVEIDF